MTKFKFFKKFNLGFIGDEWKECYLKFNSIDFNTSKEIQDKIGSFNPQKQSGEIVSAVIGVLQKSFVEGKGIDENGKAVDVKTEDLKQFPVEVLSRAFEELLGAKPNPNA
jgi:hypothetical protein